MKKAFTKNVFFVVFFASIPAGKIQKACEIIVLKDQFKFNTWTEKRENLKLT
jgi:hypothetical protein